MEGKIEEGKRKEIFRKLLGIFLDYLVAEGWAEDKAEALNMTTDYVGQEMMGE